MDFNEFRSAAVQRFLKGSADHLVDQILRNDLNRIEREFLADLVRNNIPKGPRGPKASSRKPLKAALIRYWRAEADGWKKADAIVHEIQVLLDVSETMARKYLEQIDQPKGEAQAILAYFARFEIENRRMAMRWGDQELIELYRENDLKPISRK